MKTSFNQPGDPRPESVNRICGSRSPFFALRRLAFTSPSAARGRRGVALVVTLVMLSVITFMAITFLVLSRRERGSVAITTDQSIARFTAESALQRATAELLAVITSQNSEHQFDLLVSTNYINYQGFQTTPPAAYRDPTNVSYVYPDGTTLNTDDLLQNLANLWYDPRPPVVMTNVFWGTNGAYDFRYYLDLNRNRRHDTNGYWPIFTSDPNNPFYDTNGVPQPASFSGPVLRRHFVGDPEWIGVPVFPDRPHSSSNRFLSRYAFIVLPAGKTLDVNYIHNHAFSRGLNSAIGFYRNQGVGTWEINLAAFLADLNTNYWNVNLPGTNLYNYGLPVNGLNTGAAFTNAFSFLNYRYAGSYNNLQPASQVFGLNGVQLSTDNIDQYSDGPLMLGTTNVHETGAGQDDPANFWVGADNPNHYFTMQEIFDPAKTSPDFVNRLLQAGTNVSSYDRYTYYRLLAQLGTDSSAQEKRININYKNMTNGVVVPGMQTNLAVWQPLDFFTNAANQMFRRLEMRDSRGTFISVTNIPLYPTNYYTPSVHRVLQLAANIFDATTNQTVPLLSGQTNAFFPSVFRPIFRTDTIDGTNYAWIAGYVEETNASGINLQYSDLATFANLNAVNPRANLNLYGIPWVIGAKKGFPNFNQYAFNPTLLITRKLELRRSTANGPMTVRQMFNLSISNQNLVQAWNSYTNAWPADRPLEMRVTNDFVIRIVGQTNVPPFSDLVLPVPSYTFANRSFISLWQGYDYRFPVRSMVFPVRTNYSILSQAAYRSSPPAFLLATNFETITTTLTPQWYLITTNRLRYALIDVRADRVLDYVNLDDSGNIIDLTRAFTNSAVCNVGTQNMPTNAMWCSLAITPPRTPFVPWSSLEPGTILSQGLDNQLRVSAGLASVVGWNASDPTNSARASEFRRFTQNSTETGVKETPYNPYFRTNLFTSWEANDPLVHYTIPDLTDWQPTANPVIPPVNVNNHYLPWGVPLDSDTDPPTRFNMAVKDPQVVFPNQQSAGSDNWDFPTNLFPNLGWVGRVHRGTPWQTVYLKASLPDTNNTWVKWTGNRLIWPGNTNLLDANFSHPISDRFILDLFTTDIHDNARRGQMSVNQGSHRVDEPAAGLAAWSAVLSGVITLSNSPGVPTPVIIEPAGFYNLTNPPPLVQIVTNINGVRQSFNKGVFSSLGDVFSAPKLTEQSPFLDRDLTRASGTPVYIKDEVVERIPQQIMSLLTINEDPRFVIYSFGQTLHPAPDSLVVGGPFHGMCTNYQVTAETATRAVIRVENAGGRNPRIVMEQFNILPPD